MTLRSADGPAPAGWPPIEQRPEPLAAPALTWSSERGGWEGFTVRTYDEPRVIEHWRAPDSPALTLVLLTQGVMRVEQRRLNGPWEAYTLHAGDLFLRPPGRAPYELRWWADTAEPMRTVHLSVQPALVQHGAAALYDGDPARHEMIEQVGLRDPLLAQLCARLTGALRHATPPQLRPLPPRRCCSLCWRTSFTITPPGISLRQAPAG